jgi:hypothetical protein
MEEDKMLAMYHSSRSDYELSVQIRLFKANQPTFVTHQGATVIDLIESIRKVPQAGAPRFRPRGNPVPQGGRFLDAPDSPAGIPNREEVAEAAQECEGRTNQGETQPFHAQVAVERYNRFGQISERVALAVEGLKVAVTTLLG